MQYEQEGPDEFLDGDDAPEEEEEDTEQPNRGSSRRSSSSGASRPRSAWRSHAAESELVEKEAHVNPSVVPTR